MINFDELNIGEEYIYFTGHILVYWKVLSDTYKKGNGFYKNIITYKIYKGLGDDKFEVKNETISKSRIKRENLGVGYSGYFYKNKNTFFNILFQEGIKRQFIPPVGY